MSAIVTYEIETVNSLSPEFRRLEDVRTYLYSIAPKLRYKDYNGAVVYGRCCRWPNSEPIRLIRIHPFTGRVVLERYWK